MLLAAASGLLLTLYSALYKIIKKDIDNSTVLMLRGVIQVKFEQFLKLSLLSTRYETNFNPFNAL